MERLNVFLYSKLYKKIQHKHPKLETRDFPLDKKKTEKREKEKRYEFLLCGSTRIEWY